MLYLFYSGWLVDISGSYDPAFYAAGGCSAAAVGLLFLVPLCMPADVRLRNRGTYEIGDEEMAEEEHTIWEKTELSKDNEEKDLLDVNQGIQTAPVDVKPVLRSPQFLRVHATDPTKRASWLEATTAMAGGSMQRLNLLHISSV